MDTVLLRVVAERASVMIIDIAGVVAVDAAVADLLRTFVDIEVDSAITRGLRPGSKDPDDSARSGRYIEAMTAMMTLIVPALAASLFMLMRMSARLLPALAAAASGVEVLLALRLVSFGGQATVAGLLGATLAVVGGLLHTRVSGKPLVTAATVIALIGAIQVSMLLL